MKTIFLSLWCVVLLVPVAKATPPSGFAFNGVIKVVDGEKKTLTATADWGQGKTEDFTERVTEKTEISVDGKSARLDELKPGMKVNVVVHAKGGRYASAIKATSAADKQPEQPKAGDWKNLYADEQWYKDHKQPEQVFTGTLQRHKEPEMSILMRPHRYKLGDRFLYPNKEHPDLEKLIGQKVEVRGKPYDEALEGQAVSEIWPAAVRARSTAPTQKPEEQKTVEEVAAELGGKAYPECIWVAGVYVNLPDTKVTDAGLERLKRFAQIKGLNLGGTQITDAGLKHLTGSANLHRLELNKTRITDAGLEHIKGLPLLEKLFLKDTGITDAGLKHLKGLPKLALLDLAGTKITEAGLADLKDMPQLNTMHLSRDQLTGPMLNRLKELPKVKTLGVYNPGSKGVDDLKKALPNCTVQPLP